MANKRGHGKINKLPEVLRREVDNRLIEGHTYAQIAEYLKGMGQEIHPMSVGRYGKPFLQRFESVRTARLAAKALAEDNVDRPTTELHEANNALISQILMETLISDDVDPAEKIKAANSIAQLQSAQIRNEKLKIDARKVAGIVQSVCNAFKEKFFDEIHEYHPEIAAKLIEIADKIVERESQISGL